MQFNISHKAILFLLCAIPMACNKTDLQREPDTGNQIELYVKGAIDTPATKSVITDKVNHTFNNLPSGTNIYMLMKSEYVALADPNNYLGPQATKYCVTRGQTSGNEKVAFTDTRIRYWDDAHARCSNLSIWALACPGSTYLGGTGTQLTDSNVPFNTSVGLQSWGTTAITATSIEWNVPHSGLSDSKQTATTLKDRDLLFSNNIADYTPSPGTDRRLKFNTSRRKFASGELVFYHALSKITVNIRKGEGFTETDPFAFDAKNIELSYFNIWGKFNTEQGKFTEVNHDHKLTNMHSVKQTSGDYAYILEALVVPYLDPEWSVDQNKSPRGSLFDNTSKKAMEFVIDNNKFQVTREDLYKALKANAGPVNEGKNGLATDATQYPMEAGKNYVFTFTVSKTKIENITAKVADWENAVADEQTPSNARIELNVEDRSGSTASVKSNMDIYRALDQAPNIQDDYVAYNWAKGYTTDGKATWNNATLVYNTSKSRWSTDWFWDSNKSYYHFRTLSPTTQVVINDETKGDYTQIDSDHTCSNEAGYNQMAWGAPFKNVDDSYKFTYSKTLGFDGTGAETTNPSHQIYQAIGPVKDHENNAIKVLMFHMFSGVHFTIKTTGSGEDAKDKVILAKSNGGDPETYTRTRVDLVNYYPQGKVRLGTGYVDPCGTISTVASPWNVGFASAADNTQYVDQQYYFSAVPQSLENIQIYITTPDNNQYVVDLKDVVASAGNISSNNIANPYTETSTGSGKYTIDRWYPGFKYNYTFKLKKTGIENITATVVDWETVTVDEGEVTIK